MKTAVTLRIFFFVCALVVFTAFLGDISFAHIGADNMPDSVAEVEYSIYLEFKPNDIKVRNKLGMVYYRLNKMPEADREFSRILKTAPENYDALDGMGLVKAALGDYEAAVRYHQQAIVLNPEDMMMYYHLGSALEQTGHLQDALDAYRTSLKMFDEQYPSTADNKKAAEFGEKVRAAVSRIENTL